MEIKHVLSVVVLSSLQTQRVIISLPWV